MEEAKLSNILDTRKGKALITQMGLIGSLTAAILVLKNSIFGAVGFQWTDCMLPASSIVILFFMFMYTDEKLFGQWLKIYKNKKTASIFFFSSLIGIVIMVQTEKILTSFLIEKWLNVRITLFDVVWNYVWNLFSDFVLYNFVIMMLVGMYLPVVLNVYRYVMKQEDRK